MARCSARGVAVPALVVLVVLAALVPRGSACFRSLSRQPYETYWLGTYYESRFISLTCFAVRSFRWTLKFIKVTYENWHVEMEYAKCLSETYGLNIPMITPPWGKNARMLMNESDKASYKQFSSRQSLLDLSGMIPLTDRIDSSKEGEMEVTYSLHGWNDKSSMDEFMTSLQPILVGNDKLSDINFLTTNEKESMKEIIRIVKSFYNILTSFFREFEDIISRTFGIGIFSCTKKYVKGAFWRWIDAAPFLK